MEMLNDNDGDSNNDANDNDSNSDDPFQKMVPSCFSLTVVLKSVKDSY